MPEVNLLKDTEKPDEPVKKPPPPPGQVPLSDPVMPEGRGIGDMFRSLFGRRLRPESLPVATPEFGKMSVKTGRRDERILEEKRKSAPTMIPLPEEEGGLDVNLLTEDVFTRVDPRQKLILLGVVALSAAAFVALAWFGLDLFEKNVTNQIIASRTKLEQLTSEVTKLDNSSQEVELTTKKLSAIRGLIESHIRWSKFFEQLERYTIAAVTYGPSFSSDIGSSITLSAKASTFEDVAEQYLVLQHAVEQGDYILGFAISGAARQVTNQGPSVTFTINLILNPLLLLNTKLPNPSPSVPTSTNSSVFPL